MTDQAEVAAPQSPRRRTRKAAPPPGDDVPSDASPEMTASPPAADTGPGPDTAAPRPPRRRRSVRTDAVVRAPVDLFPVAAGEAPGPDAGEALLEWYDRHRRQLPWRAEPGETADPYRVWMSEIMLQQTTVAAVRTYFETFVSRWPTVEDLAAAEDADVMAAWAGLGYYARARNLLACARAVAGGPFPATREGLRALPGVGDYTSAAIAAIAFGEAAPVVDGNVERVMSRLVRLAVPPKTAKRTVEAAVAAMLPPDRPGDFAQAMMDLGATICTPRSPACALCPLRPCCAAAAVGDMTDFPVKAPKKARAVWHGVAFVPIRPDGAVLLRRRPERGMLGGMTEVFGSPWGAPAADALGHAPFTAAWVLAGSIAHTFTHADLTVDVYQAPVAVDAAAPADAWWAAPADAGLPTVMKKIVTRALAMHEPA